MWMLDNPPPVDLTRYQLRVHGAVTQAMTLDYPALLAAVTAQTRATIDCTGGWYTTQDRQGVSIAWLLEPSAAHAQCRRCQLCLGDRLSLELAVGRGAGDAVGDAGRA